MIQLMLQRSANSLVRVLGAMFVINDKLEGKRERAIQDTEIRSLKPVTAYFFSVTSTPQTHASRSTTLS